MQNGESKLIWNYTTAQDFLLMEWIFSVDQVDNYLSTVPIYSVNIENWENTTDCIYSEKLEGFPQICFGEVLFINNHYFLVQKQGNVTPLWSKQNAIDYLVNMGKNGTLLIDRAIPHDIMKSSANKQSKTTLSPSKNDTIMNLLQSWKLNNNKIY